MMQGNSVVVIHALLAMVAIAAVTVLSVFGKVDPTSTVLVITSAAGFSAIGGVTSKAIESSSNELPAHVPAPPAPPAPPAAAPPAG